MSARAAASASSAACPTIGPPDVPAPRAPAIPAAVRTFVYSDLSRNARSVREPSQVVNRPTGLPQGSAQNRPQLGAAMKALGVIIVVLAIAGCGGGGGSSTNSAGFRDDTNQAAFETYVAGYLAEKSVDCHKTSKTDAACTTSDGGKVLVLCKSVDDEGSNDCTITRHP